MDEVEKGMKVCSNNIKAPQTTWTNGKRVLMFNTTGENCEDEKGGLSPQWSVYLKTDNGRELIGQGPLWFVVEKANGYLGYPQNS